MAEQTQLSERSYLLILAGAAALMITIGAIVSGDDDPTPAAAPTTTAAPATSTTETTAAAPEIDRSGVDIDPLDCRLLLTNDEAVLALEEDDPEGRLISTFTFNQGERCGLEDAEESGNYIIVEPTTPADFDDGATRLGTTGRRVDDIGGAAIWFGGPDAGSLTVATEASENMVLFRIEFGRVGISDDRRLEHATDLARIMLPRFPQIELPPEPVVEPVELERDVTEPVSVVPDLLANLTAGVADGRWNELDGVLATLDHLAGDDPGLDVVPAGGFDPAASPSPFFATALAVADTVDAEAAAAIAQRVEDVMLTEQSRAILAAPIVETDDAGQRFDRSGEGEGENALGSIRSPARLSTGPLAQSLDGSGCAIEVWSGSVCTGSYGPIGAGADELPAGDYIVLAPAKEALPFEGLTQQFVDNIRRGMTQGAVLLDPFEEMPPVTVILDAGAEQWLTETTGALDAEGRCVIHISAFASTDEEMRQSIAFDMAVCLGRQLLADQFGPPFKTDEWWSPSLFWALAEIAVPEGPADTKRIAAHTGLEISRPLEERGEANVFFFLRLREGNDVAFLFDLAELSAREGGYAETAASLASASGFPELLHAFSRAVSQEQLVDGAGTVIPGQMAAAPGIDLQPGGYVEGPLPGGLGIDRVTLRLEAGQRACLSFTRLGNINVAWRPGDSGDWDDDMPLEITDPVSTLLVTAADATEADYRLVVDEIVDADEECEEDEDAADGPDLSDLQFECNEFCEGPSEYYHPILQSLFGG